jgi:hypothetical protein
MTAKRVGTTRQWGYASSLAQRLSKQQYLVVRRGYATNLSQRLTREHGGVIVHRIIRAMGGIGKIIRKRSPAFKMPKSVQGRYKASVRAMGPVIADLEKALDIKRKGGKIIKRGKR